MNTNDEDSGADSAKGSSERMAASAEVLKHLRQTYGICRTASGLARVSGSVKTHLVDKFLVRGTARSADGRVLGVILANAVDASRVSIAPFSAVRDPKHLAEYLEAIGVIPPSQIDALRLVAKYVDAMARRVERVVLTSEGIHKLSSGGEQLVVAVIGSRVIGAGAAKFLAIPAGPSVYAEKGNLADWKKAFGPILASNPMMIVSACFALAAPLGSLLDATLTGLLLAGPSSTGKTTLARFVSSMFSAPDEPHQWAGTSNGIEALALRYTDLPLPLDELASGDVRRVLEVIYRISGGQTKARATVTGTLQAPASIRSAIFATGEVSLQHQARVAGTSVKAGHDARLPTVWVDETFGVYSNIGEAKDGAAFAARVNAAMRHTFGTPLPAFLDAALKDVPATRKAAASIRKRAEALVAGEGAETLSGIERRVMAGFLTFAVAGELAVAHDVLPLREGEPTTAVAYVFSKWLARWRALTQEPAEAPLRHLRDFFKRNGRRFLPLSQWAELTPRPAGFAGYIHTSKRHGEHYLIFRDIFEKEIAAEAGLDATLHALRSADLLIANQRARTLLVRMPGASDDPTEGRQAFYAIPVSVAFDAEG